PGWPGPGGALGFLGRIDEPRKGLAVLLRAFELLAPGRPELRLLIAGYGDQQDVLRGVPQARRPRVELLGQVSDADKVRVFHSVDVFCAPNTGGGGFGIVLAEAMAAGAPLVGSDPDGVLRRRCATMTGRSWPRTWSGCTGRSCPLPGAWPWPCEAAMTSSLIVIAIVAILGVDVSWRAGRLDRLHARLEAARPALDAALVRRSSVALELASSGLPDPATSVLLAGTAHDARSAQNSRERAESDLTRALRAAFGQPDFRTLLAGREGAEELLAEMESAAHQVFLARKFYNDAVAATRAARRRWLARLLRLAGN